MFRGVGANDIDGQFMVAYNILLFVWLHCMEWQGKPTDPHHTSGDASTLVDEDDEKGLNQLAWAVYDGLLLPGDPPKLQGWHAWVWIIVGTHHLVFKANSDSNHCPPCTAMSFDAKQATRRAAQQSGHAPPSKPMLLPKATPCLKHPGPLHCNL